MTLSKDQMVDSGDHGWNLCAEDGCIGVRLTTGGMCWAHAADTDLEAACKRLGEDGRLDARGVPITSELLQRLLGAAPHDEHDHALLTAARFDRATFRGDALFDEVVFQGEARFTGATFQGNASFLGVTFERDVGFAGVTFQRGAGFGEATFQGEAEFGEAAFQGWAGFGGASFQGGAAFAGASFRGDAGFGEVTFHRIALFNRVVVQRDARFRGATFLRTRQLGPMLVRRSLLLDEAVFHERIHIQVSAAALCCRRTRFLAGVQLRVRWAQVAMGLADLAAPSILTSARPFPGLEEGRWARALERLRAPEIRGSRPRLLAVRRADVAGLTLSGVDLRACRFSGAHHLDQLRVEESEFAATPKSRRWTTRQSIAEEHHWRATRPRRFATLAPTGHDNAAARSQLGRSGRNRGWHGLAQQPPAWLEAPAHGMPGWPTMPPNAAQLAAIYRALRKGREDGKDEPGAADFYYGEMEMRRHDATKPRSERLVLFLYWLFSGYALGVSRALVWLLGVLTLAAVLLAVVGLEQPAAAWSFPARLGTAALVAVEGAVFRASEQQLTYLGRLIQAVLRFAGPILLGLAVLSIRGRVKR